VVADGVDFDMHIGLFAPWFDPAHQGEQSENGFSGDVSGGFVGDEIGGGQGRVLIENELVDMIVFYSTSPPIRLLLGSLQYRLLFAWK